MSSLKSEKENWTSENRVLPTTESPQAQHTKNSPTIAKLLSKKCSTTKAYVEDYRCLTKGTLEVSEQGLNADNRHASLYNYSRSCPQTGHSSYGSDKAFLTSEAFNSSRKSAPESAMSRQQQGFIPAWRWKSISEMEKIKQRKYGCTCLWREFAVKLPSFSKRRDSCARKSLFLETLKHVRSHLRSQTLQVAPIPTFRFVKAKAHVHIFNLSTICAYRPGIHGLNAAPARTALQTRRSKHWPEPEPEPEPRKGPGPSGREAAFGAWVAVCRHPPRPRAPRIRLVQTAHAAGTPPPFIWSRGRSVVTPRPAEQPRPLGCRRARPRQVRHC